MGILGLLLSAAIKQIEAMTKIDHGADDEGHFDLPCSNAAVVCFFGAIFGNGPITSLTNLTSCGKDRGACACHLTGLRQSSCRSYENL